MNNKNQNPKSKYRSKKLRKKGYVEYEVDGMQVTYSYAHIPDRQGMMKFLKTLPRGPRKRLMGLLNGKLPYVREIPKEKEDAKATNNG